MKLFRSPDLAPLAALVVSIAGFFAAQHAPLHDLLTASFVFDDASVTAQEESPAVAVIRPVAWERLLDTPLKKIEPLPLEEIDTETLWLARCIYSETKRAQEQELVAWVVRNRVETGYRAAASYRDAVLDPYQFSAFNPGERDRAYLLSLDKHSRAQGWQQALRIAHHVRNAEGLRRPFSIRTRHFFSERSMMGEVTHPNWAERRKLVRPVNEQYGIDARRFRFYRDIS